MILVTSVSCCLRCHKMESPYPLLDSPGEVVIISRPGFRLDFPKLTTRISQKWRLPFDLLAWSIRSFPLQGETNPTVWFMGCLIYRRCHSRHYTQTSIVVVSSEYTLARVFTYMDALLLCTELLLSPRWRLITWQFFLLLTCSFETSWTFRARMTSTRVVTWSKAKILPGNSFQKKLYFSVWLAASRPLEHFRARMTQQGWRHGQKQKTTR